jgi:pyruvate/2-oxoglutarate dehydrogenase complex dihydrolipoamide dehydrogenase (E3) component
MSQHVDVAIIGAGTAGLSAMRRVREHTGNFVLINAGQYGTTCARMSGRDRGSLNDYADAVSGRLPGAEMCIPGGEHIAHLLAWSIQQHLTLSDVLEMPYYHPTLEGGMRTAERAAGKQLKKAQPDAPLRACDQLPVREPE